MVPKVFEPLKFYITYKQMSVFLAKEIQIPNMILDIQVHDTFAHVSKF